MRTLRWLALGVAVLVVACTTTPQAVQSGAPSATAPAATPAGTPDPRLTTLTIGVTQEPQSFDPHVNNAAVSAYRFYPNIYESLIQYGTDGSLQPMLADSWTVSSDQLTLGFKLHPGVKFSDGTPFNAAAVKSSLDRMRAIKKGQVDLFAPISTVNPVDDTTVDLVLSQPYAPLLAILAGWQSAIFVSPTAIQTNAGTDNAQTWLSNHTAGTGPFTLESWDKNAKIVMVRNPNYRETPAATAIQRVVYQFTTEQETLRQQLAAGDLDIVEEISPALIAPLKATNGVQVNVNVTRGASYGQVIFMNLKQKPFDDVNFRRALAYAIDYNRIVALWNGVAVQSQGPMPADFKPWFSAADAVQYHQDLAKAEASLKAGGFSFPLNPRMKMSLQWQSTQTIQRDMASLIKEDLAKIGIDIDIQSVEIPVWRQAIWKHAFQLIFSQEPMRYADPDAFYSGDFISTEYRDGGFNPGVTDPHMDDLINGGKSTTDQAKRLQYYNEVQKIVTDQELVLWLVNKQQAWAQGTNVANVVWNPAYGPHFRANDIKKTGLRSR